VAACLPCSSRGERTAAYSVAPLETELPACCVAPVERELSTVSLAPVQRELPACSVAPVERELQHPPTWSKIPGKERARSAKWHSFSDQHSGLIRTCGDSRGDACPCWKCVSFSLVILLI
jgi:hypothetical protein